MFAISSGNNHFMIIFLADSNFSVLRILLSENVDRQEKHARINERVS